MQLAITLIVVATAAAYTLFELGQAIFATTQKSVCGHACGGCSRTTIQNEKGEPVTLVPLEGLQNN